MSSSAESLAEIHSIYANDFLYGRFISISASKLAEKSAKKKRKEEKKGLLQQFAAKKWGCLGNSSKEIQLCLSQLGDQSSTAAKRTHPYSVSSTIDLCGWSVPQKCALSVRVGLLFEHRVSSI